MDRGADAQWIAEIRKSRNAPALLVQVNLDDVSICSTDAWASISWDGHTYQMNGHFLSVQGLSESFDMSIPTVTLSYSGVDQSWIAIALEKPLIDRQVVIYKAFINYADHQLIGTPVCIFSGRLTGDIEIADDPSGGCTVTAKVSSEFADFLRAPGRMTNNNDMKRYFPNDNSFKFVTNKNPDVVWGA
ncbi:hypothetical protein [Candidatus Magnetaquicoccus inordinatus]|uniref:hypothetical protein n=1 Tax=Candidatus Magnetaquicoccus inordinatus TaxID=2496818 RepID=UPI00102C9EE2|nr:hypothetical protein [Candidatus Magnetaquicoccus inordinatus]